MKNFLAVDTSSKYLTVVACVNGEIVSEFVEDCAMRHSEKLMPTVDSVLSRANADLSSFDYFACVVGAGSFTGIRIGISTVKGFALATGKPTVPITSFEVAAYIVKEEKCLVLLDALHGSFYAAAYEGGNEVLAPSYLTEEEAKAWKEKGFVPVGLEKTLFLEEEIKTVSPIEGLLRVAKEKQGQFGELLALYIRKSQAEINLEKGELSV